MTAFRTTVGVVSVAVALASGAALAQEAGLSADSVEGVEGSVETTAPTGGFVPGHGVRLGEGVVLHPTAELATAYQTNVFYQNEADPPDGLEGSPLLRVGVGAAVASEAPPPGSSPTLAFKGDLQLHWVEYLSSVEQVEAQSDLGVNAVLDLRLNPQSPLQILFRDTFSRIVRPPPAVVDENVDRDKNELLVGLEWRPGGGALTSYANYRFLLDFFERDDLGFADRMSHLFTAGAKYQWLPKTRFDVEAQFGIVSPSEGSPKAGSMPLRLTAGTSTLVTPRFGTILKLGYGHAFYDFGPDFQSYLAQVEGRYAFGPTMRLSGGYSREFADALVANFYSDHALYLRYQLLVGGRLQLQAKGELRLREYDYADDGMGPLVFGQTRYCADAACAGSDHGALVARFDALADYALTQWLNVGGQYSIIDNSTEFRTVDVNTGMTDLAAYTWQEFMVRVSAKF